ncbi:MAG: D-2-hydroxyacid dehydrogenase [Gemmatimonadaceae bacterium]
MATERGAAPTAQGVAAGTNASAARVLVVDAMAQSLTWRPGPEVERALRDAAPPGWEVRMVQAPTSSDGDGALVPSDEALAAIGDAEVYLGFGITPPLFRAAPKLRWVHSAAAGVRGALFPEMVASDVLLTNSAGIHAVPMAETVIGGLLFLMRGLHLARALQEASRWDKAPFVGADSPLRELGDCRVLVVGAGGIGREVAVRATAFGARCTGIRKHPGRGVPAGFSHVIGPEGLDDALPEADVLVLAAPFTEETSALLDARRLARLPPGAFVVNVARGALVDEAALVAALRAGRLGGAVLDVFAREPLAAQSPLWQLPNVCITPHVSPVSPGRFWPRQLALFGDNWRRYQQGAPLRNLVDKRAGY